MEAVLNTTTQTDQKIAIDSLKRFQSESNSIELTPEKGIKIKVRESGEFILIPQNALKLLSVILQNMAEGKSISIISSDAEISTQQAADMLNMSRPHLIKLLKLGEIPFKKVGSHRRILLKDLVTYEQKLSEIREEQLEFLSNQAQELNLGYE